jgi:dipeptidyl aminopeptidase/acylaminoacyl peptidase
LRPYIDSYGTSASLSIAESPKPDAPVFLIHGTHDTVIPAAESIALARDLRAAHVRVRLLLTDLVSHAEPSRPPAIGDIIALGVFFGDLLQR